jgi:hypothetical protein
MVSLLFQITHEVFFAPPNSFLAIILQLPIPKTRLSTPKAHILAGWHLETLPDSTTPSFGTLPYNHFPRTTRKTQLICYWEGVFTATLHSNGSYSIVACVFVTAGMCLPSRCLAMNVYSDFSIPAFGRYITVLNDC